MSLRLRLVFPIFIAFCASLAQAQNFNFQLLVTTDTGAGNAPVSSTVANNTTGIPIIAQVGQSAQATVVATYIGPTGATIALPQGSQKVPSVLGSPEITAAIASTDTGSSALPITLAPGNEVTFTVTFAPTNTQTAVAQITIPYTEEGTNAMPVQGAIVLGFVGETPAFTLSYALQPNNNIIALQSGGTITFPPTTLNTTATGVFLITDTGSAPELITNITGPPAGSPFQLNGQPLATPDSPFPLPPQSGSSSTLQLQVTYTPVKVGTDTAQITVTFKGGITVTINLSGSGATSSYSYAYLVNGTSTPVSPQGTITFPAAAVAVGTTPPQTSSVIVQVTNKGTVTGTINGISISGPGFAVVTPPTNSLTLLPSASTSFTISYTPTQVGPQTGTLVIGSDIFTLSGTGLGPNLTFAYVSSTGSTIAIGPTGAMVFTPKPVTESETLSFVLTNSGTTNATVSNISTTSTANPNPFSVMAPTLPLVLAAGQSVQFPLTFKPVLDETVSGGLQIDTTSVPLLGTGTTPPALPSYNLSGPSGSVSAASQTSVSVTLANTYPVDLQGVLTLTTSGNYGTDPAVQFSTGNRTVIFTIPANSTSANFAGQGSNILIQTGTVAESVTLTPSFQTTDGVDLTPASPPSLQFTIPAAAPVIETLQVANQTSSSFDLVVVGYTTTRSLSSMNVTFSPASGYTLTTSTFTIDLTGASSAWFQSTQALSFGGQFQVTVPFNLPGTAPAGKTLIQAIASASVTLSNGVGASNALQANIQ